MSLRKNFLWHNATIYFRDDIYKTIEVCPLPIALWTFDTLSVSNQLLTVKFDAKASLNAQSYSWDFGDGQTGVGVSPTHTYPSLAYHYVVKLTVENDCGMIGANSLRLDEIGLNEVLFYSSINVYPNPTKGRLTISFEGKEKVGFSATLVNSIGQTIRAWNKLQTDQEVMLNIEEVPKGSYILKIEQGSKSAYFRILRQ